MDIEHLLVTKALLHVSEQCHRVRVENVGNKILLTKRAAVRKYKPIAATIKVLASFDLQWPRHKQIFNCKGFEKETNLQGLNGFFIFFNYGFGLFKCP